MGAMGVYRSTSALVSSRYFLNLVAIGDTKFEGGVGYVNRDEFGGQSAYHTVKVSQAALLRRAFKRETSIVRVLLGYCLTVTSSSTGNGGRKFVEL